MTTTQVLVTTLLLGPSLLLLAWALWACFVLPDDDFLNDSDDWGDQ